MGLNLLIKVFSIFYCFNFVKKYPNQWLRYFFRLFYYLSSCCCCLCCIIRCCSIALGVFTSVTATSVGCPFLYTVNFIFCPTFLAAISPTNAPAEFTSFPSTAVITSFLVIPAAAAGPFGTTFPMNTPFDDFKLRAFTLFSS